MKQRIALFLFFLACGIGPVLAQNPVIYSEANINLVSPGVYHSYNCASTQTDFWTDSTYASYVWSTGQTTSRITISGTPNQSYYSPQVNLSVTVTDGQGNTSSSVVVADSLLQPNFLTMAPYGSPLVCAPDSVALGIQYVNGEQLRWSNGHIVNSIFDCDFSFQGTCFEYFLTTGSHDVIRVFPTTGCQYSAGPVNVGIFATPGTPSITQSNDTLYATAGSPNYIWYDASQNVIGGATQRFYKPTVFGNYYVKANGSFVPSQVNCLSGLSNAYNYSSGVCAANFTWAADTSGQFSILVNNLCTPTAANGGTYLWAFGDGSTSTQAYPQHQYAGPGTYNVCVTVSFNGCTNTYCDAIVVVNKVNAPFTINVLNPNAVALDPIAGALDFHAAPNPSNGQVKLSFVLPSATTVQARVLGMDGREVLRLKTMDMNAGAQTIDVDARACSQGVYFLEMQIGESVLHHRLVIQH